MTAGSPTDGEAFYDDFGRGHLDRSVWNVRTTGTVVNDEQQAYVDSSETIYVSSEPAGQDGNMLVLHPRFRPGFTTPDGRVFDFVSGRLDTEGRFGFRYGSASARMRLPVGPGLWPAFWLLGHGSWPETGEIDVMECVGESEWVSSALHGPGYSGEAGLANRYYFPPGTDASHWHVYTVDRGPDAITFRIDGELVNRLTRPMVEFFGAWSFDDEKFLILNLAIGGTYPFKTNGVRNPCYGLPSETVEAIEQGDARVLIDWVRVEAQP
jgi:beta-glucanase (GH16 family)